MKRDPEVERFTRLTPMEETRLWMAQLDTIVPVKYRWRVRLVNHILNDLDHFNYRVLCIAFDGGKLDFMVDISTEHFDYATLLIDDLRCFIRAQEMRRNPK